MNDKPLQLIIKPNLVLRPAQEDLYKLICKKLQTNESITYEEAQRIYFEKGCKLMHNGWPCWSWYGKREGETEYHWEHTPISEEGVKIIVFQWLTFNIGKLVIKGFLKVIPQIELT